VDRAGLCVPKVLRVHLIHLPEIGHVRQIHRRLHDPASDVPAADKTASNWRTPAPFAPSSSGHSSAAFGIERDLSRSEHEAVGRDRLTVGANGLGAASVAMMRIRTVLDRAVRKKRIRSAAGFLPTWHRHDVARQRHDEPAPAEGRTSRTWSVNPVGHPAAVAVVGE